MSRFDLIFLVLDPKDEAYDRKLAAHLVSLYHTEREDVNIDDRNLDQKLLRDYLGYARAMVKPVLNVEAKTALVNSYIKMRQVGANRGAICAYPRQLESLIRLSEAHAKVRLSDVVDKMDVEEAVRLYREALKQSIMDPKTGAIDISILVIIFINY